MSPLFGSKDDAGRDDGGAAALTSDIQRFGAMTLTELGAAVMAAGFGADGPGAPGKAGTIENPSLTTDRVAASDIGRRMSSAYLSKGSDDNENRLFVMIVQEGLQVLERALLVRVSWNGGQGNYLATRLGRAALERNAVARVIDGGSI